MHTANSLSSDLFAFCKIRPLDRRFAICKYAPMQIKEFVNTFGPDELSTIARRAGTTLGYLRDQVANGHRKPSPELAMRLAEMSNGRLTLAELRPDLWGTIDKAAAA